MRPSFSFPFIKPPNMIPSIDDNIFEQFTINAIKIKPEAPWIKRNSYGIKFTDKIQTTEYEEDVELSDDDTTKDRKHSINPLLKRLYIRTNSQHYSRIKYFSKEQEREAEEQKDDDDYENESKDGKLVLFNSDLDIHYIDDFDKYDKMKDEYQETEDKYDFDLNIEIPDDDDDYEMKTPVRGNKHKAQPEFT